MKNVETAPATVRMLNMSLQKFVKKTATTANAAGPRTTKGLRVTTLKPQSKENILASGNRPVISVGKNYKINWGITFLLTYIDTHGIPKLIQTDQFSGLKGEAMNKFCSEKYMEQTWNKNMDLG